MEETMQVDIAEDRPRVELPLNDGSVAVISPLSRDDRAYLVEGLTEMSLESRFARFGQGIQKLSNSEWDYLTEVDQRRHVAWVAMVDGSGAGVARYIRLEDRDCAEVAVTVLDDFQKRGLGSALFLALVAVARADGVPAFCFEVVPTNNRVREILSLFRAKVAEVDGLMEARVELREEIEVPRESEILEVMESVRGPLTG